MVLQEVEAAGLNEKYDFFYLPIDFKVHFVPFRMTAMSVMPLSTSLTSVLSPIYMKNFMARNGLASTPKKYAKSVTPASRGHHNS